MARSAAVENAQPPSFFHALEELEVDFTPTFVSDQGQIAADIQCQSTFLFFP